MYQKNLLHFIRCYECVRKLPKLSNPVVKPRSYHITDKKKDETYMLNNLDKMMVLCMVYGSAPYLFPLHLTKTVFGVKYDEDYNTFLDVVIE